MKADIDLSMFCHPETEAELVSIKKYLEERKASGEEDNIDHWIRMVATNRLTGHSAGLFSVYTLPPSQTVSQESQIKINIKRNQKPEYRDTKKIIKRKTMTLLKKIKLDEVFNSQSPLIDRNTRGAWLDAGGKDMHTRCNEFAREILATHQPEPLPEGVAQTLREIVAEAEKEFAYKIYREAVQASFITFSENQNIFVLQNGTAVSKMVFKCSFLYSRRKNPLLKL